jgi:gliding motility-associated lipoprotein GldD
MKKNRFWILVPIAIGIRFLTNKNCFLFVICLLSTVCFSSCGNDDDDTIVPKPHAYFRLKFPEKKYVTYSDSLYPFTFEIPEYSKMEIRKSPDANTGWLNLNFPALNGTINLTYKSVNGDLEENLKETYDYVNKHQVKASGIEEKMVAKDSDKVYGLIYEIGGNAASSIQFFLTDSTKNFIRGALYFNVVPNTDSIAPVVSYVREDIYHMIETFKWKNKSAALSSLPKTVNKKQGRGK